MLQDKVHLLKSTDLKMCLSHVARIKSKISLVWCNAHYLFIEMERWWRSM